MYNWITLLYTWNWHNIVNQLFFNLKKRMNTLHEIKRKASLTSVNVLAALYGHMFFTPPCKHLLKGITVFCSSRTCLLHGTMYHERLTIIHITFHSMVPVYHYLLEFHWVSLVAQVVKNLPANEGVMGSIPGSGRYPGKGNGNPLQYFCLENSMDRGAWWATVHVVTQSWTQMSD